MANQFSEVIMSDMRRTSSDRMNDIAALHSFIDAGGYSAGDRLPSERDLIVQLGMRRNALRKALDDLEHDGTIWRHVGKGTFVAGKGTSVGTSALEHVSEQMTPVRIIQARVCIEPSLAREAAIHASSRAIFRINAAIAASRATTTWSEYEAQDDLFHRTVAQASDNILLLTLFDQLNAVRRQVSGSNVVRVTARPTVEHKSFNEHDSIAEAIMARDPHAAHMAMRMHIGSVSGRLFDGK